MLPAKLTALILGATALAASASATTIIYDDFGVLTDPSSNLPGRTPDIGPNNWVGYTDGAEQGWKVGEGVAYYGSASSDNGMAGIDLGDGYFANNPAIYSLKANIQMPDATSGWYAIGFSSNIATGNSNGYYQSGSDHEGEPWMFVRNTGQVNVRSTATSSVYSAFPSIDVDNFEIELVLDTSVTNWTVAAYVNGNQLDLDPGSSSMLFTYNSNRTDIRYVGLNATSGTAGQVSSFTLTSVPEPQTYAFFAGLGVLALAVYRRRLR